VPALGDKIIKIFFRLEASFLGRLDDGVQGGRGIGAVNRFTSGEVFSSQHAMRKRASHPSLAVTWSETRYMSMGLDGLAFLVVLSE
jgi:hypothetical protein